MLVNSTARHAVTQRRHLAAACAAVLLVLQQQQKLRDRNKHRGSLYWQARVNEIGDAVFNSA